MDARFGVAAQMVEDVVVADEVAVGDRQARGVGAQRLGLLEPLEEAKHPDRGFMIGRIAKHVGVDRRRGLRLGRRDLDRAAADGAQRIAADHEAMLLLERGLGKTLFPFDREGTHEQLAIRAVEAGAGAKEGADFECAIGERAGAEQLLAEQVANELQAREFAVLAAVRHAELEADAAVVVEVAADVAVVDEHVDAMATEQRGGADARSLE